MLIVVGFCSRFKSILFILFLHVFLIYMSHVIWKVYIEEYADSSWIVPYNPTLLMVHDAHINVEVSALLENVKYLHKYLAKPPDRAEVRLQMDGGIDYNEIDAYLDGRYISTSEAIWRALKFKVHYQSPGVKRLQVHLPDSQYVIFAESSDIQSIVGIEKMTSLLAWFAFNQQEDDLNPGCGPAKDILYADMVEDHQYVKNKWSQSKMSTSFIIFITLL